MNVFPPFSSSIAAHTADYATVLDEFSTHSVIRPQVEHGRTKRSLLTTLDATVSSQGQSQILG